MSAAPLERLPAGHREWRFYGPRQGAECECGGAFYPETKAHRSQIIAHRSHVQQVTGLFPQMEDYA